MLRALILALPFALFATAALADRIDGDWCRGTQHFSIDGDFIVTPAGHKVDGVYSRHAYAYSVPPGEPAAGTTVRMILLDEKTVDVLPGPDAAHETWERCEPVS